METATKNATIIGSLNNRGQDWGNVYLGRGGAITCDHASGDDGERSARGLIAYAPTMNVAAARYVALIYWLMDPDVEYTPNGPTFDQQQNINMRQKVLTVDQWRKLVENGRAGEDPERRPVVHLFGPCQDWLISELIEPAEGLAFGLADLGMGSPELGYIDLREICARCDRLPMIERDLYWTPRLTLAEYADEARERRRIKP